MRLDLSGSRPALDRADPALRLTPGQQQAMAIDRELVVSAGAGSGKTHTLALRYIALLLDVAARAAARRSTRPDIQSVLVLTFTNKAATEMLQRCYRRLLDLEAAVIDTHDELDQAYGQGFGATLAAGVRHLAETFPAARIDTFHGLCAHLVRRYPDETGCDPDVRIIDEIEAAELYDRATEQALAWAARSEVPTLVDLLGSFGSMYWLRAAVRSAVTRRAEVLPVLQRHRRGDITYDDLVSRAPTTVADAASWLRDHGVPTLTAIDDIVSPSGGGPHMAAVIRPALERATAGATTPAGVFEAYRGVLQSVLRGDGGLRDLGHPQITGSQRLWPTPRLARDASRALRGLAEEACGDWERRALVARQLPVAADATMIRVLGSLSVVVEKAVSALDAELDERGALDFSGLQHRAVTAVLQHPSMASALTERHRFVMVDEFQDTNAEQWALVRRIGRPEDRAADRIFLVGDVKQAIYGFRGGDVTVFDAATADLGVEPCQLADNFRSKTELIHWYNRVFPGLMAPSWEPMVPGRGATDGSVRVVVHDAQGADAVAHAEASCVADLIADSILPGHDEYTGLDAANRVRHPSPPVAILLRARTHMTAFEQALRRRNVPFTVAKGVGFWARDEVTDLVNALHAVVTGDPISTVGALRSPLFGVDDAEIFAVSRADALADLDGSSHPGVQHAAQVFADLRALTPHLQASELLRCLVDRCDLQRVHQACTPMGQAAANVQRLIDRVVQYEAPLDRTVQDVARYLVRQVDASTRQAEASLTPSAARVVIMTVHAAKGLEFPVVVVPQMGTGLHRVPSPVVIQADAGGVELACKVLDPGAPVRRRTNPGTLTRLQATLRRSEADEHLRLLYVAATRARDHLVCVGPAAPPPGSWMARVLPHLPEPPQRWAPSGDTADDEVTGHLPVEPVPVVEPLPPAPPVTWIRPSGLEVFRACPYRWYLQNRVGLEEPVPPGAGETRRVVAAAVGDVLHSLLEDRVLDLEPARARWHAHASALHLDSSAVAEGQVRIEAQVGALVHDEALARALDAPGYDEVSFRLEHKQLVLSGQIDRLWFDAEAGGWVVLDYKTGHYDPIGVDRYKTQLAAYGWAASTILADRDTGDVVRCELYHTAVGRRTQFPWTPATREAFVALLDNVDVLSASNSEQARAHTRRTTTPDCGSCPFHQHGCDGLAHTLHYA